MHRLPTGCLALQGSCTPRRVRTPLVQTRQYRAITSMSTPWWVTAKRKQKAEDHVVGVGGNAISSADRGPAKKAKTSGEGVAKAANQWKVVQKSLLVRVDNSIRGSSRVAAFDLDGTLVDTKSGGRFARDADDWKFFNDRVVPTVQKLNDSGYHICIFSNQGSIRTAMEGKASLKTQLRIDKVAKALQVPLTAMCAAQQDQFRKPRTGMWDYLVSSCNKGEEVDKSASFFVGDAAGRPGDFSDSDKKYAEAIGISFKTPEEAFPLVQQGVEGSGEDV
mmetsp:Transcript_13516/g.49174  ORF Transcript_13516/g.49174 Transcript_13516/m.49174 type:complete len:277 (-) Transcript_13516:2030-2860(-)